MAALAPDPPVKLEWADVPSERVTDAEASELEELLVRYIKSNHAVPTPNGMPLRSRAGQAYERPHLSLLQKHYPSFRLHDAVTELVGLHRLGTALRMLRAVRHFELHGVQSGAQLPFADYFGRSPATRIEPPAGNAAEGVEVIDLTADDIDYLGIETLILDGPLQNVWQLRALPAAGTPPGSAGPAPRASVKAEQAAVTAVAAAVPRACGAAQGHKRKVGDGKAAAANKKVRRPWEGESEEEEELLEEAADADGEYEEECEEGDEEVAPCAKPLPAPAVEPSVAAAVRAAHEHIAKLPFDEPSGSVALMPLHFAARYACDAGVPDDAEAAANFREYRRFLAIRAVLPPLPLAMAGAAARAEVYLKFSSTAAEGYIPEEYVFPGDATQADILTAYYACQQCAVPVGVRLCVRPTLGAQDSALLEVKDATVAEIEEYLRLRHGAEAFLEPLLAEPTAAAAAGAQAGAAAGVRAPSAQTAPSKQARVDAAGEGGSGGVVGAAVPEGIAPPIAPPDAPLSAPPAEQRVVPLKSAPPPSKPAVAPVPASAGGASDSQADADGEYEEEEKVHLLLLAHATATAPTAPPQASSQPTASTVHTPRVEEAAQVDKRLRTTRPKSVQPKGFATATTREDGYVYVGNHLHVSFRRTPTLGPHSGRTVLDLTTHFGILKQCAAMLPEGVRCSRNFYTARAKLVDGILTPFEESLSNCFRCVAIAKGDKFRDPGVRHGKNGAFCACDGGEYCWLNKLDIGCNGKCKGYAAGNKLTCNKSQMRRVDTTLSLECIYMQRVVSSGVEFYTTLPTRSAHLPSK